MKTALLLIILLTAACAKDKTPVQVAEQAGPDSCTLTGTASHAFEEWGVQDAHTYACPIESLSKMTCTYHIAVDGSHRELKCQNTANTDPQSAPSYCTSSYPGGSEGIGPVRVFFDGVLATAEAINCGQQFGLRCTYYEHRPDATGAFNRDEFLCLD